MYHFMYAQVGPWVDFTGAIVLLLVIAALGLIGLLICVISLIYKRYLFFFLGLVLASPALALAVKAAIQEIPRTRSWDFSTNRSVSQLDKEPVGGRYYYQGNLRSAIKLASNKEWSGRAALVDFGASSGEITDISWSSRPAGTDGIYQEAKRILRGLGFTNHDLDSWYENVRRGECAYFRVHTEEEIDPRVSVNLSSYSWERDVEEASWTLSVEVVWKEVDF